MDDLEEGEGLGGGEEGREEVRVDAVEFVLGS